MGRDLVPVRVGTYRSKGPDVVLDWDGCGMGREWMWYVTGNGIGRKWYGTENGGTLRDWKGYGGWIWDMGRDGIWDGRAMEREGLWDCFRSHI
jgi:hypothetical protein